MEDTVNKNEYIENKEEEEDATQIIIIEEEENGEKYKANGRFVFNIDISEDENEPHLVRGKILTDVFIDQTHIHNIHNWRYELSQVHIKQIECDSMSDEIVYEFEAKEFDVKA